MLASDALVNSTEWWRISYRIIYDSYRSVFRKETVENHITIKYGMFSRRLYKKFRLRTFEWRGTIKKITRFYYK